MTTLQQCVLRIHNFQYWKQWVTTILFESSKAVCHKIAAEKALIGFSQIDEFTVLENMVYNLKII